MTFSRQLVELVQVLSGQECRKNPLCGMPPSGPPLESGIVMDDGMCQKAKKEPKLIRLS